MSTFEYRDRIITVVAKLATSTEPAEPAYHTFAKQVLEVTRTGKDTAATYILGYLPIGIQTLTLAELKGLFPNAKHAYVLPADLITHRKE